MGRLDARFGHFPRRRNRQQGLPHRGQLHQVPAVLGGIYWKRATRQGAFIGITLGFAVWLYTLVGPGLIRSGALPLSLAAEGLFGRG